jgi:hypothetical protein
MAVMDIDTGKLLNYCQLMQSTKYQDVWSLSLANKFGWLANVVGGCIKNLTKPFNSSINMKYPKIE